MSGRWGPGRPSLRTAFAVVGVAAGLSQLDLRPLRGQSAPQIARSPRGVVVAAQPMAAAAGARALERGGNAADAAVAAGFAIAVVEPSMNGIGGRNQILVGLPDGRVVGIDGTTQVPTDYDPATAPRAQYGYATVGIPGAVAGLLRLHAEHGSLPLDVVMAPAIDYAENGFRLLPGEAARQAEAAAQIVESEGARRSFLGSDGAPHRAGDRLLQPDLAATLRAIASGGADAFYSGEIADRMAADMAVNGGFVTRAGLAAYRAEDARIVRGSYRGYELVGLDIPASGAIAIQALHIAEQFDRDEFGEEGWAAVLGQALALALPDLARLGSDTASARATSKRWAGEQARRVRKPASVGGGGAAAGGAREAAAPPAAASLDDGHTTHLSVADADGMYVALTQTLGPNMGAKVATPGLGFLYAVTLGGYLGVSRPGERARSGITPLVVLRDGQPFLVLGAAGGLRIISAVVQTVSRVIDEGRTLPEALAAPRLHPQLSGEAEFAGRFSVEATPDDGWPAESLATFEELGFDVSSAPTRGAFGRVHGLQFDAARGVWIGAADPDWEGAAVAPARAAPRR